ncbi:T9SS type A sorting domain-containing protein [Psychroserpens algicola]|uniref:T9SS type A sorting domain-containing protein n=1 Tax=Psychroserpens algicola TaxID=1719034 RepID=UPI0019540165|nr:T9SS type A sorting domain-containing protein [Psychroserpens algicola]
MKTKLQKTLLLLVLALFAIQVNGQAWGGSGAAGTYRIKVNTQDLYLTLPDDAPLAPGSSQVLTYQPLDMTNNRQIFDIQQISGNNYTITSVITGKGVVEIDDTEANPKVVVKGRDAADVPNQLHWWNPTRGTGTQLFSENNLSPAPWGAAKRRVQNTTGGPLSGLSGTEVKCSGGSALKLDYEPSVTLSIDEFDTNSIFISNPVKEELTIDGLTANVKQISIYNLLGQRVLLSNIENNTSSLKLDISSFSSGMYIVKLKGENFSNFSEKIIKE